MKTINEIHIIGNVGRDAERYGNGPVKFSVATGGGTSKKTGKTFPVEWHACIIWDESFLKRIKKGCQVELTGRLGYESWTDKKTGEQKTKAVITATQLEVLGEDESIGRAFSKSSENVHGLEIDPSGIPF